MNFEIINRHGEKIIGHIDEQGRDKLAFVMHGLSGNVEEKHIRTMVEAYLEKGFAVVSFDCTHSFGKSEGAYETVTLSSYLEDLEDVIDWSKTQPWFHLPFALSGHSMGGYTVLRYAELNPENCSVVIPFAPVVSGKILEERRKAADPEGYAKWQQTNWHEEESKSRPGLIKRLKWHPHVTDSYKHDLIPDASRITAPTLIIVGENDWPCPVNAQEKLLNSLGTINKKLMVVPGAQHNFTSEKELKILRESISSWLRKYGGDNS